MLPVTLLCMDQNENYKNYKELCPLEGQAVDENEQGEEMHEDLGGEATAAPLPKAMKEEASPMEEEIKMHRLTHSIRRAVV